MITRPTSSALVLVRLALLSALLQLPAEAGRVSGRITGPGGVPVEGAAVHLDAFVLGGENGPWNAVSGADGRWAVEDALLLGVVEGDGAPAAQAAWNALLH